MPKTADTVRPSRPQVLQAQIEFFLQELQGPALATLLTEEAEAYCDLLETISLRQLLSEKQLIDWIERNVLSYAPTDGMRAQIVLLLESGLNNPNHQQMPMRQLINRQIFDLMVERIVTRPALRQEVIHSALNSPVYTNLLSDVLYHSIVDYLTTENPLARNVPGVSSLMKVGKGMIGRMGGLEATVTQGLKAYIARNLRSTVSFSEGILNKALSNENIRTFANSLWPKLEAYELGQATRHLEMQGMSYMAVVFWNQIRKTDFMKQQCAYLVNTWYTHSGNRPAFDVLDELGITREQIVREVVAIGEPLFNAWIRSGYLEGRLRSRLESFFDAPATQALWSATEVNPA